MKIKAFHSSRNFPFSLLFNLFSFPSTKLFSFFTFYHFQLFSFFSVYSTTIYGSKACTKYGIFSFSLFLWCVITIFLCRKATALWKKSSMNTNTEFFFCFRVKSTTKLKRDLNEFSGSLFLFALRRFPVSILWLLICPVQPQNDSVLFFASSLLLSLI